MLKQVKRISQALLPLLLLALLVACTPAAEPGPEAQTPDGQASLPEPLTIRVATLRGPSGIGMVQMMGLMAESADGLYHNPQIDEFAGQQVPRRYQFELLGAPEEVVAMIISGNVDIAALPSNLAANLYQLTQGDIYLIAIPTLGTLYLLENGETIHSWEDLRGRTIYATGQGANPEFILRHLLEANGLIPGVDVQVQFLTEHAELATLLAENMVAVGILPEPNVTAAQAQNSDLRVVFDFTAEWAKVAEGALAMSAVVARREFVAAYPDAIDNFLFDLKTSINFVANNVPEAADLAAEFGVIPQAALALRAIPNLNLTMITGTALRPVIEPYLQVLYNANPQSVGGALPDEAFFYIPQVAIE